jgi:hemerythrin-like domain-containing protein
MMQNYAYSLRDIENMIPWERDIYVDLLRQHIDDENNRLMNEKNLREAQTARRRR